MASRNVNSSFIDFAHYELVLKRNMEDFVDWKLFEAACCDFVHQELPVLCNDRQELIVRNIADTGQVAVHILS